MIMMIRLLMMDGNELKTCRKERSLWRKQACWARPENYNHHYDFEDNGDDDGDDDNGSDDA